MHRINLEEKMTRVDLINDIECDFFIEKEENDGVKVERTIVDKNLSKRINKNEGKYISIIFDDITDSTKSNIICKMLEKEIRAMLIEKDLLGKNSLIIGLGNNLSTPDSLGPKTIDKIIPTRHLFEICDVDKNYSSVAKLAPGVFSTTGIESFDIIRGVAKIVKPDFVIIIDALSSTTINKITKVVQITDSSIEPGSGVGNVRKEISKKKLGIDVIVIGVPTVVNLHTIVKDFLSEYDVDKILEKKKENYMVTPKEIDFTIEKLSSIISEALNNSLHNLTK